MELATAIIIKFDTIFLFMHKETDGSDLLIAFAIAVWDRPASFIASLISAGLIIC